MKRSCVSDSLRVHSDIRDLFRVLPHALHPVLELDYMSVLLNPERAVAERCWYVPDDEDPSVLIPARNAPVERADMSRAFEHHKPP
jgi:hypothetical protein